MVCGEMLSFPSSIIYQAAIALSSCAFKLHDGFPESLVTRGLNSLPVRRLDS